MSWWTSVALPAISRTVDPTGTLAKAVARVTTPGQSSGEVARAFLDPLNVTKYIKKNKTTTTTSGTDSGTTTDAVGDVATEAKALLTTYWPYLLVGAVVIFILKRK